MVVVLFLVAPLVLAAINVLKGKVVFAFVGFFLLGIFGWVGALRLAKPNSWWATRYDGCKLAEAMRRFPTEAARIHPSRLEAVGLEPSEATVSTDEDAPSTPDSGSSRAE